MFEYFNDTRILHTLITLGAMALFAIGLGGMLIKKNLFKIFLSLSIAETSLFIFFIGNHFDIGKIAPIAADGVMVFDARMVDPVPQAMILTTIVIAIAVLALSLSFVIRYYHLSGHMQIDRMDELGETR